MAENESDFWGRGGPTGKGEGKKESGLRAGGPTDTGSHWSKSPSEPQPATPEQGGFWTDAEKTKQRDAAEREALLKDPNMLRARRKRRVKRVLLVLGVTLVLAFAAGVAFAPAIASGFAPGIVQKQAAKSIRGSVTVDDVSLSWGGPQVIKGVHLAELGGKEIARTNVEVSAGLWGLITGGLDLGHVSITGAKADIVRDADGSTNLQRALEPPGKAGTPASKPAPGAKAAALPKGLRAKVVITNLDASFTDKATGGEPLVVTLKDADLSATIAPGEPSVVEAKMQAYQGLAGARPTGEPGELTISAKVNDWSRVDGTLTLDKAKGRASLTASRLPVALADALGVVKDASGTPVSLASALGPTLDLSVSADGDGKAATASLNASFANASAKGTIKYNGAEIESATPIEVHLKGAAARALAPATEPLFATGAPARLDALPDASVTIDRLKLPLRTGKDGKPDLRGASASISLALTELTGRVTLDPAQPARPFKIAPLTVKVDTDDLSKSARVSTSTTATLNGAPAGEISADIAATGILDAGGAPVQGIPGGLNGVVKINGIATAIAQPFVQTTGLDLPNDVGPTLDIELKAVADAAGATGSIPPTVLDLAVRSDNLRIDAPIELTNAAMRTQKDPAGKDREVVIEAKSVGTMVSRFIAPESGWAVSAPANGGRTTIRLRGLAVPLGKDGYEFDQSAAVTTVELREFVLRALGPDAKPLGPDIRIDGVNVWSNLRPGGDLKATLTAAAAHGAEKFEVKGDIDVKGLVRRVAATGQAPSRVELTPPMSLRPSGKIEALGMPTSLVSMLTPSAAPAAPAAAGQPAPAPPLDLGKLLAEMLAGPTNATVAFAGVKDKPDAVDASVTLKSPKASAEAGGVLDKSRVELRETKLAATISPQTVAELLKAFAPDLAAGSGGGITLAGPARLEVTADAVSLPLDDAGKPRFDQTGTARARVKIPGPTFVDGLVMKNDDGTTRPLGRVGVEEFTIRVEAPVAAIFAAPLRGENKAKANLAGAVLGADGGTILRLEGGGDAEISAGQIVGALGANVKLSRVNTGEIEKLLGKPGMLTGAMGPTGEFDVGVSIKPPPGGFDAKTPISAGEMGASLTINTPRLKSSKPLQLDVLSDRLKLREAAVVTLDPDLDAFNRLLEEMQKRPEGSGPAAQKDAARDAVTLLECQPIALTLERITLPRPAAAGGTGVGSAFADVLISMVAPRTVLRAGDGQSMRTTDIKLRIASEQYKPDAQGKLNPAGPALTFGLDAGEVTVGENPAAKGMKMQGMIQNIFPGGRTLDLSGARLSMGGTVPAAPTAVIDTLLNQKGLLVDALGPIVSVVAEVYKIPLVQPPPGPGGAEAVLTDPPVIQFEMKSPRATASFRGSVNAGLYRSEHPLEVSLTEVTKTLGARLVEKMPVLGSVEKTPEDEPALVSATGITLPLNEDWSKANAEIRFDPGEVRFNTSSSFGSILKAIHQRNSGVAGTRLEAISVSVKNGVATYPRWKVPLGEFAVETEGVVNLTKAPVEVETPNGRVKLGPEELDVVTWIPFGALTDKAAGALNVGAGATINKLAPGVLEAFTLVPFRTRGPMKPTDGKKTETGVDGELLAKQLVKNLSPERLLKEGLGDLLKPRAPR